MDAIFYGAIAGLASIAGILLVIKWKDWTMANGPLINSLAAGVILGVAFFSILPEAAELTDNPFMFVFLGFIALYLVETVIVFHSGAEVHFHGTHGHQHSSKAWAVFAGLFLHSLIDGIVIGIGFEVSHEVGMLAALGVILHELPEGATTFALLLHWISSKSATILSLLVGLATPLGALIGMTILPGVGENVLGILLAMAGGSFLYVSASDLVPETHADKSWRNALFLVAGAAGAYVMTTMLGHH